MTKMQARGPLFDGRGKKFIDQAFKQTVQKLVELGEERLNEVLRPRPSGVYLSFQQGGKSQGHYRRNVKAEQRGHKATIHDNRVVYGPWLEGISSRNQSTRFKGYASFRKTAEWLQKQMPLVLRDTAHRLGRKLG